MSLLCDHREDGTARTCRPRIANPPDRLDGPAVKLRLFHHSDGARIAYREQGSGPPLILFHSVGLSHREWAPLVPLIADRYRIVLPDLPLHGDSEDSPRFPYTPEWMVRVLAEFVRDVGGPRSAVGGHGLGGDLVLRAAASEAMQVASLVLCASRLHGRPERRGLLGAWRVASRAAAVPGLDRLLGRGARAAAVPALAKRLTATGNTETESLVRHAFAEVGDPARSRAWARFAHAWPSGRDRSVMDLYAKVGCPVLLLWADQDPVHPVSIAEEALDLLPDAQLRVLERTGYLPAYDDPVGLARELAAFLR